MSQGREYDVMINIRLYELVIRLLRQQNDKEKHFSEYTPVEEMENPNIRLALQMVEENLVSGVFGVTNRQATKEGVHCKIG